MRLLVLMAIVANGCGGESVDKVAGGGTDDGDTGSPVNGGDSGSGDGGLPSDDTGGS